MPVRDLGLQHFIMDVYESFLNASCIRISFVCMLLLSLHHDFKSGISRSVSTLSSLGTRVFGSLLGIVLFMGNIWMVSPSRVICVIILSIYSMEVFNVINNM